MTTLEGCVGFLWWDHLTGLPLPSAAFNFGNGHVLLSSLGHSLSDMSFLI